MDKNVRSIIATDKTEALSIIEPLDFTLDAGHLHFPPNGVLTTVGRSQGMPVTSWIAAVFLIVGYRTNVVKLVHRW
jgi:hypothetical protein